MGNILYHHTKASKAGWYLEFRCQVKLAKDMRMKVEYQSRPYLNPYNIHLWFGGTQNFRSMFNHFHVCATILNHDICDSPWDCFIWLKLAVFVILSPFKSAQRYLCAMWKKHGNQGPQPGIVSVETRNVTEWSRWPSAALDLLADCQIFGSLSGWSAVSAWNKCFLSRDVHVWIVRLYMVICCRQEAHKARLTTVIPQVNSNSCMFNAVDVGRLPRSPLSTAFLAMAFSEKRGSLGPRISVGSFVATWEELK